jgi:hypothetical protein
MKARIRYKRKHKGNQWKYGIMIGHDDTNPVIITKRGNTRILDSDGYKVRVTDIDYLQKSNEQHSKSIKLRSK